MDQNLAHEEPEPEVELAIPEGMAIFKREVPLCWKAGGDRPNAVEVLETFESVSALVVKYLSPVEELSPFKLGNIQKLISDIAEAAG